MENRFRGLQETAISRIDGCNSTITHLFRSGPNEENPRNFVLCSARSVSIVLAIFTNCERFARAFCCSRRHLYITSSCEDQLNFHSGSFAVHHILCGLQHSLFSCALQFACASRASGGQDFDQGSWEGFPVLKYVTCWE